MKNTHGARKSEKNVSQVMQIYIPGAGHTVNFWYCYTVKVVAPCNISPETLY